MDLQTIQKELPKVSVVILSWNGKKYIDALLKSLLNQSYPKEKTEIILVDNGSTDRTVSFVQKNYPQVKCLSLKENIGFAAGNNHALKYAKYDFLVFLNVDTVCHRDWLKGLVLGLLKDKKIGACTSNMILPEVEEFRYKDKDFIPDSLYYYDLSPFGYGEYCREQEKNFVFSKIISGCSFIIHKKTIAELGYLFDEDFGTYVEDVDLSLRIHNLGLKTCVLKNSLIYHLHKKGIKFSLHFLSLATKAIMNRVCVFFKNMGTLEFSLYFPVLFIFGIFKIFKSRLKFYQKVIYFFPFALFSMICMILALFCLPKYVAKRRLILKKRRVKGFSILKLVLCR